MQIEVLSSQINCILRFSNYSENYLSLSYLEPTQLMETRAEITEAFHAYENQYRLFDKEVSGVPYWAPIRFDIWHHILYKKGVIGALPISGLFSSEAPFKRLGSIFYNTVFRSPIFAPRADYLFIGHPRRKRMYDALWWDLYTDPIIVNTNTRTVVLEKPYNWLHYTPTKTLDLYYLDGIQMLARMWASIPLRRAIGVPYEAWKNLQFTEHQISEQFGVPVPLCQMVMTYLRRRMILLPFFIKYLQIKRCAVLILSVYYGHPLIIEAAKRIGIPVVELQHGIMAHHNLCYNYPRFASSTHTPDYILTFGTYWSNLIQMPIPQENIIPVGFPYFEMQRDHYCCLPRKKQIVFISQWAIGEKLASFALCTAALVPNEYEIVFKLHPGEYGRQYPHLQHKKITTVRDEIPLYKILAESEMQIGVHSTALYEGIGMGIPKTGIVNYAGSEYMDVLIQQKLVKKITKAEDVIALLGSKDAVYRDPHKFFMPNAVTNIWNSLKKIRERHSNKIHSGE